MPASQSKITFDAINIVKAENIYLNESKKVRIVKRKMPGTDEIMNQKKKIVSDFVSGPLEPRSFNKNKKSVSISKETKLKNASLAAAKKSRKRQMDIGNAYSKLNSQRQNQQTKPLETSKTVLSEVSSERSSFYLTPRQNSPNSEIDFENINPNKLPDHFYESELDDFIRKQYPDFEESSEYDFQEPFTIENFDLPEETFHPKDSLRHFKELLDQEESSKNKLLEKSEIELLKDIIKADERYQKLKRDDYLLLKEILMGQLKEISEQERVIKIALERIRSRSYSGVKVDVLQVVKAEQPLENNFAESNIEKVPLPRSDSIEKKIDESKASPRRQEVDVFFKNVPSLEREIRILKLLGRKLEETLKKSSKKEEPIILKPPVVLLTTESICFKHSICNASSSILLLASKSILGIVQEFKISHQTIDELKLERDFYIASDLDNFTLQRTNFDNLRNNPEMLLRRLKPFTKDSRLKFNVIEQDPLFFNHFLANICKISSKSYDGTFIPKIHNLNQKSNIIPTMAMNGAGDHFDFILKDEDIIPKLELPVVVEKPSRTIIGKKKFKQRRTPLQEKKFVSAKNSFIKIILLSLLHLTIGLLVFGAVFYPDVICI
ncbi:uncharacterized protein LOC129908338 [Episyrphus balteatus]|uniref:uncharacterized protein LOC129908338 n=1 Tax=Episyrphus balteatus TaxID=286459 RepID=UPI002484DEF8|nr:uncharacterized protein LOC129908338 [Episyrphus balteatus]